MYPTLEKLLNTKLSVLDKKFDNFQEHFDNLNTFIQKTNEDMSSLKVNIILLKTENYLKLFFLEKGDRYSEKGHYSL